MTKTFVVIAGKKNGIFRIVLGTVRARDSREAKKLAKEKWAGVKHLTLEEKNV